MSPTNSCSPAFPGTFDGTGNWTSPLYAVSVAGVLPTACVTWFQANQLCRLSGKRLLTNREWQGAAAGTPDPGSPENGTTDCNTGDPADVPVNTGSRSSCVSKWGASDMVGNVQEWVADWADLNGPNVNCATWSSSFGDDISCFGGTGDTGGNPVNASPGALNRGGFWLSNASAGVFNVFSPLPTTTITVVGFRCAR